MVSKLLFHFFPPTLSFSFKKYSDDLSLSQIPHLQQQFLVPNLLSLSMTYLYLYSTTGKVAEILEPNASYKFKLFSENEVLNNWRPFLVQVNPAHFCFQVPADSLKTVYIPNPTLVHFYTFLHHFEG